MGESIDEKRASSPSIQNDPDKPGAPIGDMAGEIRKQLVNEKNVPASSGELTPEELTLSKRVNRKMDLGMLPILSLLYLFNGLDKGNVGNAETQGEIPQDV